MNGDGVGAAAVSRGRRVAGVPANAAAATTRAAVVLEPRNFVVREVARPKPAANQVLVRLEGCGVCASNIPPWEGQPWFSYPMPPGALGHESWGRVEEAGADVTEFAPGDRVAMISNNAYAEFDVGELGSIVKLPCELESEPFPAEPLACAMNIFQRSEIKSGDHVAIVGIGFLGAILSQLATAAGAHVLAITRRAFALRFAIAEQKLVFNDRDHVIDVVKRITSGSFSDVVIEATGKQPGLDLAAELTRERGRLVIAGYHQDGPRQVNMQLWNWRGLDVVNAHERDPRIYLEGMQRAVDAVRSKLINPTPLYTHRFSLDQIGEAFRNAAERPEGFMKALIMYDC